MHGLANRMADVDAPDYPEVCTGQVSGRWLILQVITGLYPKYLWNTEGAEAAQAFVARFPGTRFAALWDKLLAHADR